MSSKTEIAICGAGIAGVATAYYLAKKYGKNKVVLIDKQEPLSFTSSKSGENFRDFWPQQCMADFVRKSIKLMEDLRAEYGQDAFAMEYSGYNFVSHQLDSEIFPASEAETELETITSAGFIRQNYSYLDEEIKKIVRIPKAGKVDAYGLGSLLLKEAKKLGVRFLEGEIQAIKELNEGFRIKLHTNSTLNPEKIVIATGPFINQTAGLLGLKFPVFNQLQRKFIIPDPEQAIPRNMPFTIYADDQYLDWTDEETALFTENEKWLLEKFPGGLHIKPESGRIQLGWAFNNKPEEPAWESTPQEEFPNIVLKGASRFIPELKKYAENMPSPLVQYAGYYTRTKENWPLIGPAGKENVFVTGALSGYGIMAACAAGELCAGYISGENELPAFAPYFHPGRYSNPLITRQLEAAQSDGQL